MLTKSQSYHCLMYPIKILYLPFLHEHSKYLYLRYNPRTTLSIHSFDNSKLTKHLCAKQSNIGYCYFISMKTENGYGGFKPFFLLCRFIKAQILCTHIQIEVWTFSKNSKPYVVPIEIKSWCYCLISVWLLMYLLDIIKWWLYLRLRALRSL